MIEALPKDTPGPEALKDIRLKLGLSQRQLAEALGFGPNGPDMVRWWEAGYRAGAPFTPTGPAWAAFRYLATLVCAYRGMDQESPEAAKLARLLPECLR